MPARPKQGAQVAADFAWRDEETRTRFCARISFFRRMAKHASCKISIATAAPPRRLTPRAALTTVRPYGRACKAGHHQFHK
ncbi:hypothetical protein GOD53_09900 [Sinorhizobium medicae]|nr:hypothetical protein [Sinorhizobium medicae]MDX0743608.1 hypothetical protein [Sinorhizobium medicae]MDX0903993.1 hypothetical protein [Sinorhizobium medicae]MDX1161984.1 hypothetical protein [Sinorhizobium medicae]RVO78519.1 hypothetical protein CN084_12630 [Sinorhizobium medicae]